MRKFSACSIQRSQILPALERKGSKELLRVGLCNDSVTITRGEPLAHKTTFQECGCDAEISALMHPEGMMVAGSIRRAQDTAKYEITQF